MLIKLTHRGKPTLVNTTQIVSVYMDTDLKNGEFKTKVNFVQGCVFVDESLIEIQNMMWEVKNGKAPNMDYEVPTIDDRIEMSYEGTRQQSYYQKPRTSNRNRFQPRDRWNNVNSYNDNNW